MTTSTGKTGQGVTFEISDGASPSPNWTAVANVRSINPTGKQADEIDFTHLASTGGYREFRQGFKDGGTINLEFHFSPLETTQVGTGGLLDKFNNSVVFTWRINFSGTVPASPAWNFALTGEGFVQNPGDLDINVDGPVTGSATVRVTGPTTLVAVS